MQVLKQRLSAGPKVEFKGDFKKESSQEKPKNLYAKKYPYKILL